MVSKKYSIGVDFGTESGRAVLVEVATGREVATSVYTYKHRVIDEFLPVGVHLSSWNQSGLCKIPRIIFGPFRTQSQRY